MSEEQLIAALAHGVGEELDKENLAYTIEKYGIIVPLGRTTLSISIYFDEWRYDIHLPTIIIYYDGRRIAHSTIDYADPNCFDSVRQAVVAIVNDNYMHIPRNFVFELHAYLDSRATLQQQS